MTQYNRVIGTGGIGSGVIYRLRGDHNLGRNESRTGQRLPQRDFCKLHIIFHYVTQILRDVAAPVEMFPIGGVGADESGRMLLAEMRRVGMNNRHVHVLAKRPTLFSFCYQFADGSGGNITEENSASAAVLPALIRRACRQLDGRRSLVLAVPEVPLASRAQLLAWGRRQKAFTAASFLAEEMNEVRAAQLLRQADLVSLNIDEAAALAQSSPRAAPRTIVARAARHAGPSTSLFVTHGKQGIYSWQSGNVVFYPALTVKVVNTAGAGDAFFAGLLLGKILGGDGIRLGRLLAAISVTSPDTIHFGINRRSLAAFARAHGEADVVRSLYV